MLFSSFPRGKEEPVYHEIKLRKDGLLKVGKFLDYYMDKNGTIFND